MKYFIIARKELSDILTENTYLFTLSLQIFIVIGIIFLGGFYSEIQNAIIFVGDVMVDSDDEDFYFMMSRDARIRMTQNYNRAIAKVTYKNGSFLIESDPNYTEIIYDIVEENYNLSRYNWSFENVKKGIFFFKAPYIEIMSSILVPLIILLPIFISMNILSDSIVTEKERKTLEILMCAPIKRSDIALGKLIPVVFLSFLEVFLWIQILKVRYPLIYNEFTLYLFLTLLMFLLFVTVVIFSTLSSSLRESNLLLTLFLMLITFLTFFKLPQQVSFLQSFSPFNIVVKITSNPSLFLSEILSYFGVYSLFTIIAIFLVSKILERDEWVG
ncbi:MAG: ABC transporter permease subunit [Candidatus Methanofastidiosia archaeon]